MLLLYLHPEFQFLFQSGGMNFLHFAFHHEGIATCLIILTISADAFSIKAAKKATSSSRERSWHRRPPRVGLAVSRMPPLRIRRLRSWHTQPIEVPIAVAVCFIDKPNSKSSTTVCACSSWSFTRYTRHHSTSFHKRHLLSYL